MPDSRAIEDNINGNSSTHVSSKNYLLAIGISEYENFSKLPNGKKDVVDLHKVLTENFDFEPALTKLLTDDTATRENITDELHELSSKLTENDRLLIYYSGHGLMSGESGYWIPKEAKRNKFSDYVSNAVVRDIIKNIKARHILLISDSCFSASLFVRDASRKAEQDISWLDKKASRWVFISGKGEVSDGKPGKNSPFAENIINQLLESKTEDLNIAKIADSVRKEVRYNYEQEAEASPLFQVGHDGGEFVFVRKKDEVALQVTKLKQAYEFAKANLTIHNLNKFLDDFPNSPYEAEIEILLEEVEQHEAFEEVKRIRTTSACRNFLKKFPQGIYADKVNAIKKEILSKENIERENQERERIEREKQERERLAKLELEKREKARLEKLEREKQERERLAKIEKEKLSRKFDFEPKMVLIKGGTFDMGDVMGDNEYEYEKPVHSVTLSDFYLGIYTVTQAQWQEVMGTNPSNFKGDNLPVETVSWNDVQEFLKKLNQLTGKNYRLPTEAEWEYAAREGGKKVRFGNGKNIANPSEMNFNGRKGYKKSYSEIGEFIVKTTPVGSFNPHSLGLYDMSGNVWEWCEDDWHSDYKSAPPNGNAWVDSPRGDYRVLRGGSWFGNSSDCRVANRIGYFPAIRSVNFGFRVARYN